MKEQEKKIYVWVTVKQNGRQKGEMRFLEMTEKECKETFGYYLGEGRNNGVRIKIPKKLEEKISKLGVSCFNISSYSLEIYRDVARPWYDEDHLGTNLYSLPREIAKAMNAPFWE